MAVYRRGYHKYEGPMAGRWAHRTVLPRFAWRQLFQQRLVLALTVIAMIWPFLCALFIYLSNHADLLQASSSQFKSFIEVNGKFFLVFMNVQGLFAVILSALVGPGLIAPDLANNALPLYFSRPLSRMDYALARLATLMGMLSIITWIPGLLLFGIQAGMAGSDWLNSNWRLCSGIIVGFAIWLLLISIVALASSAYARLKIVSGALVLAFFFVLSGASVMINGVFRVTWGHALNPAWAASRLWYAMFNVDPPAGPGVGICASVLAALICLLGFVLLRKLRPIEVIS
jgi:ABC-2 type transport system permease protein